MDVRKKFKFGENAFLAYPNILINSKNLIRTRSVAANLAVIQHAAKKVW